MEGIQIIEQDESIWVESIQVANHFNLDHENHKDLLIFQFDLVDTLALLETATILSFKEPRELTRNLNLVDLARHICLRKSQLPFLFHSVRETIMKNFLACLPKETDIHDWFKAHYKEHLGNDYEIIKRKNNPKHIPDFWLLKEDAYTPVEIKLNSFDSRHLKQLQRYMDFYKCQNGIAVAASLNCELPANVMFIPYNSNELIIK